jgi:hypothetical protein
MGRRGHCHYTPTLESLKTIDDFQIKTALRVLFNEPVSVKPVDRMFLEMIGVPQFEINQMSDRQVRKFDLKPFAFRVLHHSISALVNEHRRKEEPKNA